jgi:hypothetical protein
VRRYAGDEVSHVMVFEEIAGASGPRRGLRLRAGEAPVEITRVTIVDAAGLADEDAAAAWLEQAAGDDADDVVGAALVLLRRAVAGRRIAGADPALADPDPTRARVCRVGYGNGEQVARGEWEDARELPPPKRPRSLALSPQERLAALLGARDVALACEELTLRARADLDAGRGREAAMQTRIALEAAVAELESWRGRRDIGSRLDELAGHREPVAAAATTALEGGLDEDELAAVGAALVRIEAALRARNAASLDL